MQLRLSALVLLAFLFAAGRAGAATATATATFTATATPTATSTPTPAATFVATADSTGVSCLGRLRTVLNAQGASYPDIQTIVATLDITPAAACSVMRAYDIADFSSILRGDGGAAPPTNLQLSNACTDLGHTVVSGRCR